MAADRDWWGVFEPGHDEPRASFEDEGEADQYRLAFLRRETGQSLSSGPRRAEVRPVRVRFGAALLPQEPADGA